MLSNAHFLAKFRFDTAENEPAKKIAKFSKNAFSEIAFSEALRELRAGFAWTTSPGLSSGFVPQSGVAGPTSIAKFAKFANLSTKTPQRLARIRLY